MSSERSRKKFLSPEGNWEGFLSVAQGAGLDVDDPHMQELYDYIQVVLPGLQAVDELDLSGVDPAMVYFPPQSIISQEPAQPGT